MEQLLIHLVGLVLQIQVHKVLKVVKVHKVPKDLLGIRELKGL
jgi:hypothetical protein